MKEGIGPLPFWEQWAKEHLTTPEKPYHNEVWTISGKKGVGKTTIAKMLEEKAEKNGIPLVYYNPGEEISYERELEQGVPLDAFDVRTPEQNHLYDTRTAEEMIDPKHSGKILLIDSRIGGFNARELELAAKQLGLSHNLPITFHNILIYTDTATRREHFEKVGIGISPEKYDEEEEKNFDEYKRWAGIRDLHVPFLKDSEGKAVYHYYYEQGVRSDNEIVQDIWNRIMKESAPHLQVA